ncbi:hypothetical protein [Microbulbifer thermotolerans]|uniref:hypothetical protein n=1 Tax=Microbulbifer thermotolerans TaxID=252514 RepID=UPI0011142644|nr:hypothetical protein [Microbulbifer thermotolerans]MCX2778089.1 hypothetical protein [Microbulbifer thermotolerans]MCX2806241.1 hypothetical protein [Microbulbifer thermotolerans]MCX2833017.1 hypothetical protein [Microbulbifer thermotolerans]MCX2842381.1 hypothetical protein [Microbulbifer thermotolerans]
MTRVIQLFLVFTFSGKALAIDIYCGDRKSLDRVDILNSAYEAAKVVFLANVEAEHLDGPPHLRWRYSAISPILKGEVAREGYFYLSAEPCKSPDLSENAVFLVFLQDQQEILTSENTLMVVYNRGNAHEGWALEWAKSKVHNNAKQ